ncbi:hypothetical protein TRV_01405 [Trichophyton verrucosum HKI 0517]|uniref:RRM domain-containing protein n=1 Tax=Trichophyton verrucosum (strain HKI 0517) TaxID=663202 RepID=D4D2U9_TRIVH|nr:uncharacterized protein TRV_01405 [Trichophyton verrucosum HKI 0517]EFE43831.1 hypothetical protein TRV_01405 [Trichophyton verrucosum HKI 0517]
MELQQSLRSLYPGLFCPLFRHFLAVLPAEMHLLCGVHFDDTVTLRLLPSDLTALQPPASFLLLFFSSPSQSSSSSSPSSASASSSSTASPSTSTSQAFPLSAIPGLPAFLRLALPLLSTDVRIAFFSPFAPFFFLPVVSFIFFSSSLHLLSSSSASRVITSIKFSVASLRRSYLRGFSCYSPALVPQTTAVFTVGTVLFASLIPLCVPRSVFLPPPESIIFAVKQLLSHMYPHRNFNADMKAVGGFSGYPAVYKPGRRQAYPQARTYWRPAMQVKSQAEATAPQCQGTGYMQENQPHHPYVGQQTYGPPAGVANNPSNVNGSVLAHPFNKMSLQSQPNGSKPFPVKGGMPMLNVDMPGMQHYGQYMMAPNGPMFGGYPPAPQFGQFPMRATDQGSSLQCIPPNFYPGFPTNPPFTPDCVSGYPWPYYPNGDFPNHGNIPFDPRTSVDEVNTGSPNMGLSGPPQDYYSGAAPVDRSSAPGYTYNNPTPQQLLPYQMMKTGSGYVLQDLDALLKQEPPIPRAVPAMWTNPSDLTLAKCLENREGITNVYIRGFLPETTDEMLHNYASRFGKIDRCKAIIDLETGLCKGYSLISSVSVTHLLIVL